VTSERQPPPSREDVTSERQPPPSREDVTSERQPPPSREDVTSERQPPPSREDASPERQPPRRSRGDDAALEPRRPRVSVRRRVFRYLALAALCSCVLTVAVAVVLVRHRVAVQRRAALQTQASVLAASELRPGVHVFRLLDGRAVALRPRRAALVLAALPPARRAQGTIAVHGRSLLYVSRPTYDGEIVLVRPAALAFGDWRPFLLGLLIAGAGGLALALVMSLALARRLTRPAARLAAAARELAAGREGVQVPLEGDDELAALARSFNLMSSRLAAARAAERTFLESVSHELKTPLTSIRGYAEALADGAVEPADGSRVILAEAGRLERLVSDLLELARVGRANFRAAREPLDLRDIAGALARRHAPRARALGVELRLANCGEPAPALGDPERLLQAASNLVENALRVTPAGGSVELAVRAGELAVRDTGPGLRPKDLPHAFERFYLHRRYHSERPVGSGLGLAIVKELVEAMGGSVDAAGREGGGACFWISLPLPDEGRGPLRPHSAAAGAGQPCA
jgi:signal transduction histidine kinase